MARDGKCCTAEYLKPIVPELAPYAFFFIGMISPFHLKVVTVDGANMLIVVVEFVSPTKLRVRLSVLIVALRTR